MTRRESVRRDGDFRRLWAGQAISSFGSLVSRAALPFTAVLTLHAGAAQMALLAGVELGAGLLGGVLVGGVADRVRRRPLMIAADLLRALTLAAVPITAAAGTLSLPLLLLVAAITGLLSAIFDVAYEAYLPGLVGLDRLAEANSAMSATASAMEVFAFALAGVLVQLFSAPGAVAIDAASFLVSALSLLSIHRGEQPATATAQGDRADADHVGSVLRGPLLRPLLGAALLSALSYGLVGAVWLLFVSRNLAVAPAEIGMLTALGGAAALVGAACAPRLAVRLGDGPLLILAGVVRSASLAALPLTGGSAVAIATSLGGQQLVGDSSTSALEVTELTLRQTVTPPALLGRVAATFRTVSTLGLLLGTACAGWLGSVVGLRAVLVVGACCPLAGALLLLVGGFARIRSPNGDAAIEPI